MDEISVNAEKVLKGKKLNPNGKELFDKTIKKAVKQSKTKK